VVVGAAVGFAQIAPSGWRPASAFLLVLLVGATFAYAYVSDKRRRSQAAWVFGGVLVVLTLLATFLPAASAGFDPAPDSVSPPTEPSSTPGLLPSGTTTEAPEVSPSESVARVIDPMRREVDVQVGSATVLYDGDLRLGVSSVYDDYAVMGIYTSDQTCDSLFPDVGRTMVIVTGDSLAYEVTLLASQPDTRIRVEVRRRAPTEFEGTSCPSAFG
jgi:hypothetical protein